MIADSRIVWLGDPPTTCDLCGAEITDRFNDGRVKDSTTWGIFCDPCFRDIGIGYGPGKGQAFEKRGEDFVKVQG